MDDKTILKIPEKTLFRSSSTVPAQQKQFDVLVRARSFHETQTLHENRSASIIALEELVQCGICIDKLLEPKMLPCQHTFCLSCLRAYLVATMGRKMSKTDTHLSQEKILAAITNAENEIPCPTCQIPAEIGKGFDGLQHLPSNVYIDSLLKVLNGSDSPKPHTSTRSSAEIRCVKCQTVCQFQNENCGHCKQIFCKVCWTEHLSVLRNSLYTLIDHLNESETSLKHRVQEFQEYCDLLRVNVDKAVQEKILEIKAKEQDSVKQLEDVKKREEDAATVLRDRIMNIKREIEQLKFEAVPNDKQKVEVFMNFHRDTSNILNEISRVGDLRLGFDPKTFKVKRSNEFFEKVISGEDWDVTDSKNVHNPLESIEALATHYRSRKFKSPKLVWTKCPRPAGLGIPPWAPNLLYIAATDRKVVLIMDRDVSKVIGKLSSPEMLCPHGLAFSKTCSEIYVTDKWRHCIHIFSSEGDYLRTLCCLGSGAGELRSPEGIAVNQKNQLVVCDVGNDRVIVLDPVDGQHIFTYGMTDKRTELQAPTGVAICEDKVIIADNGNHRIKVFSVDGEKLLEFGSLGNNTGQFRTAEVVACDPLGFILVGDAGNARIQVFQPDGSLVRVIGSYGEAPGKFAWISGLLVTPQLEVIVTDYKNKRLQIF